MKMLLFMMIFFILGALLILSNNNLALYDGSNVKLFFNLYSGWLDKVHSDVFDLTGKVIEFVKNK